MPSINVHIAPVGNALSDGEWSNTGHMWFTLVDEFGNHQSYGFAPAVRGDGWGPGKVYNNDDDYYVNTPYNYEREISQDQYNDIVSWAQRAKSDADSGNGRWSEYAGLWNSCVDFTWEALNQGGLTDTPENGFQGNLLPWFNRWAIEKELLGKDIFAETINAVVNTAVTAALNWVPPRRDPLVLDLDGGGITTSGINPNAPILFDQDGDGTKVATGWIAAGEAIVVRDLDGNGTIDSGRELFGDNTFLTHGPNAGETAANGFEALADLDADVNGVADGVFDSDDVASSGVRLWKDANQDAISQAGELFTFADLGIQSINLSASVSGVDLGGGNTQTFAGSFTRTDGQTGDAGTAELAGSLLLANNNFYREFTDDPAWTTEAQNLPQMTGSGAVRDLRPAMSLGTAQALDLQAKVAQVAAGTTRDEQQADLDALIQSWGATSTMQTSIQTNRILAHHARRQSTVTDDVGQLCPTRVLPVALVSSHLLKVFSCKV